MEITFFVRHSLGFFGPGVPLPLGLENLAFFWNPRGLFGTGTLLGLDIFFGGEFIFPSIRFKPGTAGYEARTQPLCHAPRPLM